MHTISVPLAPCAPECFCVTDAVQESTRRISGKLTYLLGYDLMSTKIQLMVPSDFGQLEIYCLLTTVAKSYSRNQGATEGYVRFRVDGSDQRLSLREWRRHLFFQLTGRGAPVLRTSPFSFKTKGDECLIPSMT